MFKKIDKNDFQKALKSSFKKGIAIFMITAMLFSVCGGVLYQLFMH